jgi:DNA polymerase/3'-5' exonuclease PolX
MELDRAREIADGLVRRLSPGCVRIEVAGSVRRGKAEVNDIELVAVPKMEVQADLFGGPGLQRSLLDPCLVGLGPEEKSGPRYKQILLAEEIYLDLFIVLPPAQ